MTGTNKVRARGKKRRSLVCRRGRETGMERYSGAVLNGKESKADMKEKMKR